MTDEKKTRKPRTKKVTPLDGEGGSGSAEELTEEQTRALQASRTPHVDGGAPADQDAIRRAMGIVDDADEQALIAAEYELARRAQGPGSDPSMEKINEIMRAAYQQEATDITNRLILLEKNEPALRAYLADLEAQRDAVEEKESARAATPLALILQIIECEFATTHYPPVESRQSIPTYEWGEQGCIFGKERPDQDCRTCVHHRVAQYGDRAPMHGRRYARAGWVIPIQSDDQAEQLALFLRASQMTNLRNVDMEIAAVKRQLDEVARQKADLVALQQRHTQGGR